MNQTPRCFSEAPIFSKLSERDRSHLLNMRSPYTYEKGHYLCWQDDIWPVAGFIVSGSLEWVMLSPDGRRQVVFRLNACDVIWAHSLIDNLPMPASLEVKEAATLYLWDKAMVMPLILRYPEAALDVSGVLIRYMRQVRATMYGFAFQPVAGRLARMLIEHFRPEVDKTIQRTLTLEEMAEAVGTTKELISRTLHRFADDGMIQVNRMEFVFKDVDKLEQVAGG